MEQPGQSGKLHEVAAYFNADIVGTALTAELAPSKFRLKEYSIVVLNPHPGNLM